MARYVVTVVVSFNADDNEEASATAENLADIFEDSLFPDEKLENWFIEPRTESENGSNSEAPGS